MTRHIIIVSSIGIFMAISMIVLAFAIHLLTLDLATAEIAPRSHTSDLAVQP